jgi:hypothetical protein
MIRLSGIPLGGKLSLAYLVLATFMLVGGGQSSELALVVFRVPGRVC